MVVRLRPWKWPAQRRIPRARRHDPRRAGSDARRARRPALPERRGGIRRRVPHRAPVRATARRRRTRPATSCCGSRGASPGPLRAVLAHKDEIGAMVKRVEERGRLRVGKLGGSFPWVWGEGPVDVLGRHATVPGVLSFGVAPRLQGVGRSASSRTRRASAGRTPGSRRSSTPRPSMRRASAPARGSSRPSRARRPCAWARTASTWPPTRSTTRARSPGCSTSRPGCGRRGTPPSSSSPPARRSAATGRCGTRATPTPRRSWRSR